MEEQNTEENAISAWNKIWNRLLAAQDLMGTLYFHNLFGTILDEKEQDLRINVLVISDSSSGKTEGARLVEKSINLVFESSQVAVILSTLTDSGLVGGVDEEAIKWNRKHGLSSKMPSEATNKAQVRYKQPIIFGELESKKWIGFDEAETVLKPTQFNQQIQLILRKAMDRERRIDKRLKDGLITIRTNASFLLASYKLEEIRDVLFTQGLFQRMVCLIHNISEEESKLIEKHIIDNYFGNKLPYEYLQDNDFNELISTLKDLKMWYEKNRTKISAEEGISEYVKQRSEAFLNKYAVSEEFDAAHGKYVKPLDFRTILNSLFRRGLNLIYRLAVHYTVLDKRTSITKSDIDKAFALYKVCFESVVRFIFLDARYLRGNEVIFAYFIVQEALKKSSLTKTELTEKVMEKAGWGKNKSIEILDTLRDVYDLFDEERAGTTLYARLRDTGV